MRRIALLLALLSALAAPALAADRWALLIGVDKCKALGELKVCAADAHALRSVLEQVGYPTDHVILLTDDLPDLADLPTIGNIKREVDRLVEVGEPGDTIVVFFSGHGVTQGNEGYLIPVDGDPGNAIALSWLRERLGASRAENKILLDACHAGAAKGVNGIAPDLSAGGGVAMLLSCDKNQVSWPDETRGLSVFAAALVDGLAGKAAHEDRNVTAAGLFAYARQTVREWSFKNRKPIQTPQFSGETGPDVVLATCPAKDVIAAQPGKNQEPPPQQAWLGTIVQNLTPELSARFGLSDAQGALVSGVLENSPAKQCGLQAGDVIIMFGGQKVPTAKEIMSLVAGTPVGKRVPVIIVRDHVRKEIEVEIGARPASMGSPSYTEFGTETGKCLGMTVRPLLRTVPNQSDQPRFDCAEITELDAQGPAASAGLQIGDKITEVDRMQIQSVQDFVNKVNSATGKSVILLVGRSGWSWYVAVPRTSTQQQR